MRSRSASTKNVGAELMQIIEQIGNEKGIDVEILVTAVEDAITTASRKHQERTLAAKRQPGSEAEPTPSHEILVCRLNRQSGALQLYARKRVVEEAELTDSNIEITVAEAHKLQADAPLGGYVELPRETTGLGRIEAQAAKQVMFQKVREAERDLIYNEYRNRVGQLINGNVKRFERGDLVIELGRAEALLPRRFQSRTELYSQGDRVRAVIIEVSRGTKGPQLLLSRTDPTLLVRLFEMEVPEIYDGTVALRHVVREPGERSKVAVASTQKDVDAVGACVGMKGSRVQAIIRELRGEKIDIVQWSGEIAELTANALNPARVGRVSVSSNDTRTLEVVVEDQQLSLAIGKKGQNVRLASKLVGWRIDIKSEDDKRKEVEDEMTAMAVRTTVLAKVPGVAPDLAATLDKTGIRTVADLLKTSNESLAEAAALDEERTTELRRTVETFAAAPGTEPDGGDKTDRIHTDGVTERDSIIEPDNDTEPASEAGVTPRAET